MSFQVTVTTETLRRLHRIQRQLQDLHDRQEQGPRVANAHEGNLTRQRGQLEEIRGKARMLKVAIDGKQLQLQGGEENVQKRRRQLREAKDNREYQALLEQIAADEMANSVLADEILETMERFDEVSKQVVEAEDSVKKAEADAARSKEEFDRDAPRIQGDLARLEEELRQSEDELPGDFQDMYRRLVRAKGSDALAPMLGEFCGGCNQHVPLNMYNSLALSKPVFCRSCGRLLYLPEGSVIH